MSLLPPAATAPTRPDGSSHLFMRAHLTSTLPSSITLSLSSLVLSCTTEDFESKWTSINQRTPLLEAWIMTFGRNEEDDGMSFADPVVIADST